MEPKKNTPRIVWLNMENNQQIDPEMAAWLEAYLARFLAQTDEFLWGDDLFDDVPDDLDKEPDVEQELALLDALDATVQGDELPDTLNMIMSAVKRVREGE